MSEEQVFAAALSLPPDARLELADKLCQSVEESAALDVDPELLAELDRRVAAYERGEMRTCTTAELFEKTASQAYVLVTASLRTLRLRAFAVKKQPPAPRGRSTPRSLAFAIAILHQLGLDSHRLEIPGRKRLEIDFGQVMREIVA